MNNKLILVKIDADYCNYLRKYDNKVPYNYNKKELRPFIGVLFEVSNCKYFAPLTSPKQKHLHMRQTIDFLKLDNGKLGAINLNNMIPVTNNNIKNINFKEKIQNKKEIRYIKLLKKQIYYLNRNSTILYGRAQNLYENYVNGKLPANIKKRCCDFSLLEEKCKEYNKLKVLT